MVTGRERDEITRREWDEVAGRVRAGVARQEGDVLTGRDQDVVTGRGTVRRRSSYMLETATYGHTIFQTTLPILVDM